MPDPLAVVGLGVGLISLTFQVFAGCIKGCQLLSEAKCMPKKHQYLRVRLVLEQYKLLDWAVVANLSENDETMNLGIRLNKHVVTAALHQIESLLLDFDILKKRYNLTLELGDGPKEIDEDETLQQTIIGEHAQLRDKALNFLGRSWKYPKKLRWATFDDKKFSGLLTDLSKMNNAMMYFLDAHEKKRHFHMQEDTFMQVLQVNTKLDDLLLLVQSMSISSSGALVPVGGDVAHQEKFIRMARFKAFKQALVEDYTNQLADSDSVSQLADGHYAKKTPLPLDTFKPTGQTSNETKPFRSSGMYKNIPAWVEWKYYDNQPGNVIPDYVERRISNLSCLLGAAKKPEEFLVPDCMGYIYDVDSLRFGLIFIPQSTGEVALPVTLHQLLTTMPKPSLTTRIKIARALATSIWYLHSMDWLHKGIRSENILFQEFTLSKLSKPSLGGFDYARPAGDDGMTEKPLGSRTHEFYRHPGVLLDVPREGTYGFRKIHDIYSLGVVLLEIGAWESIQSLLGVSSEEHISPSLLRGIKRKILEDGLLQSLESHAGRIFTHVSRCCIEGDFGGEQEGIHLQQEFGEKVVKVLDYIKV